MSCGGAEALQYPGDYGELTMKTSWRSASLVATAASVLMLTTACGQDNATTPSSAAQNVGATAAAGDYGSATAGAGTGAGNGYGADGSQSSSSPTPAAPAGSLSVTWARC
jgi:hypothetical protein